MKDNDLKYTFVNDEQLPLVIEPQSPDQGSVDFLIQYLQENNQAFKDRLIQYGAILFRGFHCNSPEAFSKAIDAALLGENYNYELCEVPRTKITDHVYTSVNLPPDFNLELHNEKSHDPNFPTHVFFTCIHNAEQGGYTPLADAHKVWLSLPDSLQEKLKTKGIRYRKFAFGRGFFGKLLKAIIPDFDLFTWMSKYNSKDRKEVEQRLQDIGYQWHWTRDDNLIAEYNLPAYRVHPITGKIVWFNQSNHLNYYNNNVNNYFIRIIKNPLARFLFLKYKNSPYMADFGDGQCFSKQEATLIKQAIEKNTIATPWQPGDFMVLDNYSCMHGKTPHVGKRLILAGLTQYPYQA